MTAEPAPDADPVPRAGAAAARSALDALLALAMVACTIGWMVLALRLADRHDSRALRSMEQAREGLSSAFFAAFLVVLGVVGSAAAVLAYVVLRRWRSPAASAAIVNVALGLAALAGYLLLDPAWR